MREQIADARTVAAVAIACAYSAFPVFAQTSADAANEANNPLTPKITLNVQDQWAPRLYGSDDETNAVLLRGTTPHRLGGFPQILRLTLPIATVPDAPESTTTGLGDLNLFNLFLSKHGAFELGFGPQLTIPTAPHDATGTGKWQAGVAAVVIAPQPWGLLGGLATWQHSFAGDDERPTQDNLSFQPFLIYNLRDGWYLRSTASMNFDLRRGNYVVPLGFGAGKVWPMADGSTVNVFAEPQWTVAHNGVGQPKFQVFAGINLQFPVGH